MAGLASNSRREPCQRLRQDIRGAPNRHINLTIGVVVHRCVGATIICNHIPVLAMGQTGQVFVFLLWLASLTAREDEETTHSSKRKKCIWTVHELRMRGLLKRSDVSGALLKAAFQSDSS